MKKLQILLPFILLSFITLQSFLSKPIKNNAVLFSQITHPGSTVIYKCCKCNSIASHHNVTVDGTKYCYVETKNCNTRSSKNDVIDYIKNDLVELSKGWVYDCD